MIVIKMIVMDLDGTILNSDRKISIATNTYLKQLKDDGYVITIATGRIYASALKATDGAQFASYIISDTGTCIYDRTNDTPIISHYICYETAMEFFDYYNNNCRYIDFCDKNMIYKYSDEPEESSVITTTKDKEYIMNHCKNISHIGISMKDNDAVMEVYNKLVKQYPELEIIIMQDSFSDRKWIEILPKGMSKYTAIQNLANHLHIQNEEIIAFGDGLNDIEMLEKCGHSVALQNALPEVKKVAKDVTKYDHNHDGVIEYLKGYLYAEKEV